MTDEKRSDQPPARSAADTPQPAQPQELGGDQLDKVAGGFVINLGPNMAQIKHVAAGLADEALKNSKK